MRQKLDTALGRITMYRLVLGALGALTLAALLLSAAGQLAYTPVELLVSLAVALGVTVLSSAGIARLFRHQAHMESALITAMLLFFLFRPTVDPRELLGIAVAAFAASASKYLLAIRGRHLFNAAAVGAFVIALSGLNFAVWWAATPYLLPVVAAGAFLVLYRTGQLATAAVFVVLSAAIIVARMSIAGAGIDEALLTTFGSFPLVFLAGFMLSEPLTLPPRRWQQLLVAAVVAVLFAVPFQLGSVFSSPELAILAGNLVAFAFGQRRGLRLIYRGRRQLTPTSYEFRFEPAAPVKFAAGQYMELTVPHRKSDARGIRRVFSITSAPDDGEIAFGLRMAEPLSSFKQALLELPTGTVVSGSRTGGDFILPRDESRPLLFIGAGIGVTPFLSHLNQLSRATQADVVLIYIIKSAAEFAYADQLRESGAKLFLVSPEPPASEDAAAHNWAYLGPGPLTASLLVEAVPDVASRTVLVSGSPANVQAGRAAAAAAGARRIKTDAFSGY